MMREGVRKMWGSWTELERAFLDAWQETYGRYPDDWCHTEWAAGKSALLKWFDWLDDMFPPPGIELLRKCMEVWREELRFRLKSEDRMPSLYDFKREYDKRSGRSGRAGGGGQRYADVRPEDRIDPDEATRIAMEVLDGYREWVESKRACTDVPEAERRRRGLEPNVR